MDPRGQTGHLKGYIEDARWFGGKGRPFEVTGVRRLGVVGGTGPEEDPVVVVDLVEASYDDGGVELYQVPLALYVDPESRLDHAFVGWWEDPDRGWVHAYDAVHDRRAMARYLQAFLTTPVVEEPGEQTDHPADGLTFVRIAGHDLEAEALGTLFSGEQSNSSVLYGEDAILKVFRKITPGENPDITTHRVLTDAGSEHVAALYGWIEAPAPTSVVEAASRESSVVEPPSRGTSEGVSRPLLHLAMLQEFLRTASDGWEIALASVRDLFSEADLHADEVGGDFAAESARLGTALAEVHELMRKSFGVSTIAATSVAQTMNERLDAAIPIVPGLEEHADRLRGAFAALADLGELSVQRIHGDLHLGQTLRTVHGWKLVDFEGEPAKPLAERLLPDSPWRDVAGMLRSFDYAPHAIARSLPEDDPAVATQRERRAVEWAARNKEAFLAAYADGSSSGPPSLAPEEGVLVAAYVADKAIYECVYEARNRPSWLPIPLTAIARIGTP